MPDLLAAAGDIGSSVVSGLFNQASARDARHFESNMSNTAYQRAAADLEKAGLNRILALGNPASTPSSPMASMPDAKAGSAYAAGSTAKTVQNVNNETVRLLQEQQRKTRFEGDAAAEQAANIRAQTQNLIEQTHNLPLTGAEIKARTKTYPESVNLMKYQSKKTEADTRLSNIQGDVETVKKAGWQAAAPWIESILELLPKPRHSGNARYPSGALPWWPGSSKGSSGRW